jgi:hypothetical protein
MLYARIIINGVTADIYQDHKKYFAEIITGTINAKFASGKLFTNPTKLIKKITKRARNV